ncbi:MAG TPA: glycosyltransferase family 4 protein [Thermomicrobiales bacterium]|nr:glycosyltransferase family 4 protein [Thermomicrobiales bacterium]
MVRRSILIVAPCLPLPADFGGAIRTFHLARELARHHDVKLVAPATRSERGFVQQLGEICDVIAVPSRTSVRQPAGLSKRTAQLLSIASPNSFLEAWTWQPQLQQVIDRLFLTRRVDLVQYEFAQMAIHRPSRPCPSVIDAHNIEHGLLDRVARTHSASIASHLKRTEARKVRRLERRLWASVTGCVATSKRDADVIARHTSARPLVVPNGVDTAAFARSRFVRPRPRHVVFTGVMRHQPNVDGVHWYLEQVHPLVLRAIPDATVSIVGGDPPASITRLASRSVEVTGRVDDVRPYLHEASVAIVPLLSGGGTRLKIIEAFAAGVPVVSTPIGAEGLDTTDGVDLFIGRDAPEFAARVASLIADEPTARRIAATALARAVSQFDWSLVARKLEEAHELAYETFRVATGAPD